MGEKIIVKKLAEELGVSRSMVRQVLAILVREELLTMIPRNGFYVKEITRKEIEEIYNIRKILEPMSQSSLSQKLLVEILLH
jgi:DNA-binding GntR family transcriptional regulator